MEGRDYAASIAPKEVEFGRSEPELLRLQGLTFSLKSFVIQLPRFGGSVVANEAA